MRIGLEWRPPWPVNWDDDKKRAAADRLVEYMTEGTLFESKRRMIVTSVAVVQPNRSDSPYLTMTLEN